MSKYFQPLTIMLTHDEQYYLETMSKERGVAIDSLIAHLIIKEYNPTKRVKKEGKNNEHNSI